jgi:hypothetical protein
MRWAVIGAIFLAAGCLVVGLIVGSLIRFITHPILSPHPAWVEPDCGVAPAMIPARRENEPFLQIISRVLLPQSWPDLEVGLAPVRTETAYWSL